MRGRARDARRASAARIWRRGGPEELAFPRGKFAPTLAIAPELARLGALEKVLFLMTRMLIAEHPTLSHFDPLAPHAEPRTLREA